MPTRGRRSRLVYRDVVYPSFALAWVTAHPELVSGFVPSRRVDDDAQSWSTTSSFSFAREDPDEYDLMYSIDERHLEQPDASPTLSGIWGDPSITTRHGQQDDGSDDTFERLNEALNPDLHAMPRRVLLRRRLSTLILDLAVKVALRLRALRS